MRRFASLLKPGGIVIGGSPVTPELFRRWREASLRKRARPYGHVSVFSPQRIRDTAADADHEVDFLSGAYAQEGVFSRKPSVVATL